MNIISNASPLISIAILNQLDLLYLIFDEIYLPQAVFDEVTAWGKPYSQQLKAFSKDRVKSVQNKYLVQSLHKNIDLGEAETIALAIERNIVDVLIDDSKGRKMAQLHGLYPIGTIGVLLEAKNLGHLSKIKPSLDKLIANKIRIGRHLYQHALTLAGER